MSRARQQRNKARARAAVQMTAALAATGRPPMAASADDTPIYAALAAVMPISSYDPADGNFAAWPAPAAEAAPTAAPVVWPASPPARPAWAADTGQIYRLDRHLAALGATTLARAVAVRALAAARQPLPGDLPPLPAELSALAAGPATSAAAIEVGAWAA